MRRITGRRTVEETCPDLLGDESNLSGAWCLEAAWPDSAAEASEYMRRCAADGIPLTFSGARTGVAAGALPEGGAILSATGLKSLRMTPEGLVEAGAGVTIAELRSFLEGAAPDRFYPPDPTEETASVGGTIATDASGSDGYLYGSTRRWIRRLEILLPGGSPLVIERGSYGFGPDGTCAHPELGRLVLPELDRIQPPKNAAGYCIRPGMDLVDLFTGAEGTLGLVTAAWLETAPRPARIVDLALFPESMESFWELYREATSPEMPPRVRAVEMMDARCLAFVAEHASGFPPPPPGAAAALLLRLEARDDDALDEALVRVDELAGTARIPPDSVWGGFEPPERKRLRDLRHALPEAVNREVSAARLRSPGIHKLGSDGAVPPSLLETYYRRMCAMLEASGERFLVFGHAGEGHLHANVIPTDADGLGRGRDAMREIAALSVAMGGTVSAEHGLGRLKSALLPLMYSPRDLAGMETLRRSIDPDGLLMPSLRMGGPS